MKIALFYHSVISDWNNGHAHFIRGIASELVSEGHHVVIYEPSSNWSLANLLVEQGQKPITRFFQKFPNLIVNSYDRLDLNAILAKVDLAIVHEWNSAELIREIGSYRKRYSFCLLFHDTHHRAVTDPTAIDQFDLRNYDGVLAFGAFLRNLYLKNGWTPHAWVWHEAADTRIFKPHPHTKKDIDLVWIGNWGDDERSKELYSLLIDPIISLNLRAEIYGVRFPPALIRDMTNAGIKYCGWIPNYQVPHAFARARSTVHVPRKPYSAKLEGIPTIRPFEAMACGIPLISAPWKDTEHLFNEGKDYLTAHNREEMMTILQSVLSDSTLSTNLSNNSLRTILHRHTCRHRVTELLDIYAQIDSN